MTGALHHQHHDQAVDKAVHLDHEAVLLAQSLIRCPSVTPQDAGALKVLEDYLTPSHFTARRMPFKEEGTSPVDNSYITYSTPNFNKDTSPHFCFAGHTDVVPAGEESAWTHPPFFAHIENGILFGRGAVDMKSAIACFAVAAKAFCQNHPFEGKISLLITGDEEGPSINGTKKMLARLTEEGERFTACIVGEPTCESTLGDTIKIGRRGNFYGTLTTQGTWGHTGYVAKSINAAENLVILMRALMSTTFDEGNPFFEPTSCAITHFTTPNTSLNVIPGKAEAHFNIRFNTEQTEDTILQKLHAIFTKTGIPYTLHYKTTCLPFLTEPGTFTDLVQNATQHVTGKPSDLKTTGGTSDARFIKDVCPVVDFGLCNATIHKTDECVSLDDIKTLTHIYFEVLTRFFKQYPYP